MNYQNHNPHYDRNTYTSSSEKSSKSSPGSIIIMGLFFLIIGIFLTVIQVSDRMEYNNIVDDGNSVFAQITDVDRRTSTSTRRTSSGRRRKTTKTYYYVDAVYEVDNTQYPISFKTKSASYSEGGQVQIFYEDGNPANYVREGDDGGSLWGGIASGVMGIVMTIAGFKKYRDEKDLKAMGLL